MLNEALQTPIIQCTLLGAVVLFALCRFNPTCKYAIKYGLYHLYIVFIFTLALLPCLFRPGNSDNVVIGRILYHFSRLIWWLFGFNLVSEGEENLRLFKSPGVFMCNHQSSLDCLVIAKDTPRPTATLAKKSLLYVPLFGWAAWLAGTVFIDRRSSNAIDVMKKLVAEIKRKKTNIWIFPEGTRCQNDSMLPFKKGGFHLAVEAQIPIIPVVVGNCRNFLDIPNKIFDSGTIHIRILPPIETTGLTKDDVTDLTKRCRDVMLEAYNQLAEDYKEEYVNMKPLPITDKND